MCVCACSKKEREAKRFSKQVAAERKKERAQDKKTAITSISALRKQREKTVRALPGRAQCPPAAFACCTAMEAGGWGL